MRVLAIIGVCLVLGGCVEGPSPQLQETYKKAATHIGETRWLGNGGSYCKHPTHVTTPVDCKNIERGAKFVVNYLITSSFGVYFFNVTFDNGFVGDNNGWDYDRTLTEDPVVTDRRKHDKIDAVIARGSVKIGMTKDQVTKTKWGNQNDTQL